MAVAVGTLKFIIPPPSEKLLARDYIDFPAPVDPCRDQGTYPEHKITINAVQDLKLSVVNCV